MNIREFPKYALASVAVSMAPMSAQAERMNSEELSALEIAARSFNLKQPCDSTNPDGIDSDLAFLALRTYANGGTPQELSGLAHGCTAENFSQTRLFMFLTSSEAGAKLRPHLYRTVKFLEYARAARFGGHPATTPIPLSPEGFERWLDRHEPRQPRDERGI